MGLIKVRVTAPQTLSGRSGRYDAKAGTVLVFGPSGEQSIHNAADIWFDIEGEPQTNAATEMRAREA